MSKNLEWELAGDTGGLPWIGQKSGRNRQVSNASGNRTPNRHLIAVCGFSLKR